MRRFLQNPNFFRERSVHLQISALKKSQLSEQHGELFILPEDHHGMTTKAN